MPVLYALIAIALAASAWFGVGANDAHDAAAAQRIANETLRAQGGTLRAELQSLEELPKMPLRYDRDALSIFVTRALEAGETLGAGLRVSPRDQVGGGAPGAVPFVPVRAGVDVAHLTIQGGIEGAEAPAVLTLLEEDLMDLPITVSRVKVTQVGRDVGLSMDVDVPGRVK